MGSETGMVVLNKKFFKFHSNLVEGFRIDLKAFLSLAVPNQYSETSIIRTNWGGRVFG